MFNKTIGLLRKIHKFTIVFLNNNFKIFYKAHLDYLDIIYSQVYNVSFHQKMESIRCNSTFTVTGARRRNFP